MPPSKNSTAGRFLTHFSPALKPLRVLWNEIIGFLFIVMGVIATPSVWRNYKDFARGDASLLRVLMPLMLAALLLYFGVTSFLRARKISKS